MSQTENPFELLSSEDDDYDVNNDSFVRPRSTATYDDSEDSQAPRRPRDRYNNVAPPPYQPPGTTQEFICDFNQDPQSFTQQFIELLSGRNIDQQILLHSLVNINDVTNDTLAGTLTPDLLKNYIKNIQTTTLRDIDTINQDETNNPICNFNNRADYGIDVEIHSTRKEPKIWYYEPENIVGSLYEKQKDKTNSFIGLPQIFIDEVDRWETKLINFELGKRKEKKNIIKHIEQRQSHSTPPLYFLLVNPEFSRHHATLLFWVKQKFYSIGVGYSGNLIGAIPSELLGKPSLYTPDYMLNDNYTIVDIGIVRKSHVEKIQEYINLITNIRAGYKFLTPSAAQIQVNDNTNSFKNFLHTDIDHSIYTKTLFCSLDKVSYCAAAWNTSNRLTNCTNFIANIFSDRITCEIDKFYNEKRGELNMYENLLAGIGYSLGSVDPAYCVRRKGLPIFTNEHIEDIYCSLAKYIKTGKIKRFLNLIKYNFYQVENPEQKEETTYYSSSQTDAFANPHGLGGTRKTRKTRKTKKTRKARKTSKTRKTRKTRKARKN